MNLIASAPLWLLLILACAGLAAAIEDAARFRISNLTSAVVLIGAVASALIEGPQLGLWQNLLVFIALLVLGTAAFSAHLLGGGDVKLFAAASLWFDLRSAVWFVVFVFIAGGLVALLYLASRPFRRLGRPSLKSARVPYGIAIALGLIAMILIDGSAFKHPEHPVPSIRTMPRIT